MKDTTKGAWILHHAQKLHQITDQSFFEEIYLAGRSGQLLSALSESSNNTILNSDQLKVIAQATKINTRTQLPAILNELERHKLIDRTSAGGIAVIGITNESILRHCSKIFEELEPDSSQDAVLELSNLVSDTPKNEKFLAQYLGDTFKIQSEKIKDLLKNSHEIGFVDAEIAPTEDSLYFNGNLFRVDNPQKMIKILDSLTNDDRRNISELNEVLEEGRVIDLIEAERIIGHNTLSKLQSIGMYDINVVENDSELKRYLTKPAAFGKYGNPFEEDALDLAKAFVVSLHYGMTASSSNRGQIFLLKALLKKLINGEWVGPATAIGQDYKVLEYKRVVQIEHAWGSRYRMRLLKKGIGEIALNVLENSNSNEAAATHLLSGSVTRYEGPEQTRSIERRNQPQEAKKEILNLLRTFGNSDQ